MDSPVPVAVFLSNFEPGGTERQTIELVRRLDPRRFEVHVACFQADGKWRSLLDSHASSVSSFPISRFHSPRTARQAAAFARWCRARRIAVVQSCDLYANIFALPGAALARVPVRIGSRRGLNSERGPAHLALQRAAYQLADKVVANSRAMAKRLRREGIAEDRIVTIPNGIDAEAFASQPDAARGQPRKRRVVLTVGRMRAEKGHEVLLEAARGVLARHPSVEFRLVGDGPEEGRLRGLAGRLGLTRHVTFAGHCENVAAALSEADVFVLPSLTEAFPNALMEAMAASRPVVATNVGGVPELVESEVDGLLVPPNEPITMADTILRLLRDDELAHSLGRRAREKIQRRYSFDLMVASFDELYSGELGRIAQATARPAALAAR